MLSCRVAPEKASVPGSMGVSKFLEVAQKRSRISPRLESLVWGLRVCKGERQHEAEAQDTSTADTGELTTCFNDVWFRCSSNTYGMV